jgi:uncharacterized membrane protein YphA (DoxX/SURF4 family)
MTTSRALPRMGVHVFSAAAMALGLVGLVWRDFADVWQPVPAEFPHRTLLAYVAASCFVIFGAGLEWPRTAKTSVVVLMALYLGAGLLWLPRILSYPKIYGTWAGFFEQFSVAAGGLVLLGELCGGARGERISRIGTILFGVCAVSFGLAHFTAIPQTAAMVPGWIPPGRLFWAWATGVFHLLAGIAIVTGVLARLASRLLTAMLVGFGLLVWLPTLWMAPHAHISWAGNAVNLSLTGAAWVVADWFDSLNWVESLTRPRYARDGSGVFSFVPKTVPWRRQAGGR